MQRPWGRCSLVCLLALACLGAGGAAVSGFSRGGRLAVLAVAFAAVLLAGQGRRGWRTALAIVGAGVLIVCVLAPLAKAGVSPVLVVWPLAGVISTGSILLITGWSRKSFHAIAGSLVAVLAAGWLPLLVARSLNLTGLSVGFGTRFHLGIALWYAPPLGRIDFSQLLVAGMILAGLGAVMDMAMTVATAMAEVRAAAPGASGGVLARAGLNVGRDVLGMSAVSVVLIMVGDDFHRLLMYHVGGLPAGSGRLLSHEEFVAWVVRAVSCALALVMTIPLTALFAGLFPGKALAAARPSPAPCGERPRRGVRALRCGVVVASIAAVAVTAFAIDRGTRAWYHRLPATEERIRGRPPTQVQRALGRVVALRPPHVDEFNEPLRENPLRGSARVREQPAVIEVLTGGQRGAIGLATNVLGFLPTRQTPLAPGGLADISVRTGEGQVDRAEVRGPSVRFPAALALAGVAVAVVILLLGVRGAALAAALAVNLLLVSVWLMPWVLGGRNALVGAMACSWMAVAVFVVFSGQWNRKVASTVLGAVVGMAIAMGVVSVGAAFLGVTGLFSIEALLARQALPPGAHLDFADVLVCSVVLAIVGIVLDVAMSVASAQEETLRHDPQAERRTRLLSGLRVSGDVTSVHILTLLFVLAGARVHVLFLPEATGVSLRELANAEGLSVEFLRVFGAVTGILATGPATAVVSSWLMRGAQPQPGAGLLDRLPRLRVVSYALGILLALAIVCAGVVSARRSALPRLQGPADWRGALQCRTPDACRAFAGERRGKGETGAAALALWRALELAPQDGASYRDLAAIYVLKAMEVPAYDTAQEAVRLSPEDPNAHYVMGVAAAWLAQHEEAEAHLRRALALDPEHDLAEAALNKLYTRPQTEGRSE